MAAKPIDARMRAEPTSKALGCSSGDPGTCSARKSAALPVNAFMVPRLARMAASLTEIVIDCNDAQRIADFWCAVLGWPLQRTERGDLWTSATGGYDARP